MAETQNPCKTMILGVGNLLLRDEGVGVHAAVNLVELPLPDNIEVVEGGTDGFGLFNLILETDRLIVVDCVKGGGEPASIYSFDIDDYQHFPDVYKTSVHQISIEEVISLTGAFRKPPRTTIIGIEPAEVSMSMELSPRVLDKLPRVMELAIEAAGVDPAEYSHYLKPPFIKPGPDHRALLPT
ncbi:MAG: hydrogenase maturation protease [Deltaproteobacteria bacterium]|nr:hydrogenase maturation protease [Deltaproteobacteria bacterium]